MGNSTGNGLTQEFVFGDSHVELDEMGRCFEGLHIFIIWDGEKNTLYHIINSYYF